MNDIPPQEHWTVDGAKHHINYLEPGKQNIIADQESRQKNIDTEWMFIPQFLHLALSNFAFSPIIDLFTSRINK